MISIRETTLRDIDVMRMEHLSSLPEFQDLFLELQVARANVVELSHTGKIIGYVIINGRVMVEFFVRSSFQPDICMHFRGILKTCGIETILVQSFDKELMTCCSQLYSYHVVGLLYRNFTWLPIPKNTEILFRQANRNDLPFLQVQEDEVFEPKELLPVSLDKGEIILCLKDDNIIGCGFITRIHPLWEYYDVGVWVSPAYRMKGYGTRIISWLLEICNNNSWIPICGCEINNQGSERILEKNGFTSNHQLLAYDVTV